MGKNRNLSLALNLAAAALGMLMLAYASVPLYKLFCRATGFGGTTQQATSMPSKVLDRTMTIRFNADIEPALNWRFKAPSPVTIHIGAPGLVSFTAENKDNTPTTGNATFNVTPDKAGQYFVKVQCFCFTEQTLPPHAQVNMPVSFFIDPAIANDPDLNDVHTITLSYTFFHVNKLKPK